MVVSVGPYIFQTEWHFPRSLSARSFGIASPPQSALSGKGLFQPASNIIRQVDGVACMMLIFSERRMSSSMRPSFAEDASARTNVAPLISGRKSSNPAISNEMVVTASRRSVVLMPGVCRMLVIKLTRLRCSMFTPLGMPVEPEV